MNWLRFSRFTCAGAGLVLLLLASTRAAADDGASAAAPAAASATFAPEAVAFFEAKIRPVLVQHCYACHSAEAQQSGKLKAGLQLDTRAGTLAGGESGPAVVPGQPNESLLLAALRFESFEMPPGSKLPEHVIADFARWIADGAADPRDGRPVAVRRGQTLEEGRALWSLQPIRKPALPEITNNIPARDEAASARPSLDAASSWPRGPIDRFILAGLTNEGLRPAPDADRAVLLRRLTFDLTGLPPRPDQLDRYLSDDSPQATEAVVDRLLASPAFGERWGRHWLDLARYAESCGSTRNMAWHHAWRYRDYVIDAVNRDLPYDRFLREQLAGDLLPADSPEERDRLVVATGFLALGSKTFDEPNAAIFTMDRIDEQIDVVSRVFLGLSVACARCHDHKFEAIPTADYYALAGIFRSTETLHGNGPKGIKNIPHGELAAIGPDAERLAEAAREYVEEVKRQTLVRNTARSDRYRVVRRVADMKRGLSAAPSASPAPAPSPEQAELQQQIAALEAEILDWDERIKAIQVELDALLDSPPPQPDFAMAVREEQQPQDCRIHVRGETTNLGPGVPRGALSLLPVEMESISPGESGRRQLADWLASPHNPLTPRVAVNRIWQHLFGQGLVASPDDFGVNGARPSHPELLDYLAARFLEEGWSTKRLIREIVLSRTYQLGSDVLPECQARDPDNLRLWRMRPRRLTAEAFRDAVLSATGRLSSGPLEPSAVARLHPQRQDEFNFSLKLPAADLDRPHRSVYLPVVRGSTPELLSLFDFADPSRPVSRRNETTVPVQASFLLNSPWMIEQSRLLAERLFGEIPEPASEDETPSLATRSVRPSLDARRIERLYLLALARRPTSLELEQAAAFLAEAPELLVRQPAAASPTSVAAANAPSVAPSEAWTSLCQIVLASAEFRYLR